MQETIRVPVRKDAPEFVTQGNLRADKQNGAYETTNPRFAQYLADMYGVADETIPDTSEEASEEPAEYPTDFPGRKVFLKNEIPFETVQGLTREQLIDINGIREKLADKVLAYFAEGGE